RRCRRRPCLTRLWSSGPVVTERVYRRFFRTVRACTHAGSGHRRALRAHCALREAAPFERVASLTARVEEARRLQAAPYGPPRGTPVALRAGLGGSRQRPRQ